MWSEFFQLERLYRHVRKKTDRCDHYFSTDGVSVSALMVKKGTLDKKSRANDQKKPKKSKEDKKTEYNDARSKQIAKIVQNYDPAKTLIVGIDPGKKTLLYCTSDTKIQDALPMTDNKSKSPKDILKYSFTQREWDCRTQALDQLVEDKKTEFKIAEKTKQLSNFQGSKKSSSYENFKNYIVARKQVEEALNEFYQQDFIRIRKWKKYRKRQRSEDAFINSFKKKFGENILIAYGDWGKNSNPNIKNTAPSPNCHLLKKFKHRFKPKIVLY